MDVTIQIINYKTKKYLVACIDSVINDLANSGISYRILILENDSGDNLSDIEKKYENEAVEFYRSEKNLGFGNGHNLLATKAKSKYLFALNPDTIVMKDAIKILYGFMEDNPAAGLCGPRIEEAHFLDHLSFWPKKLLIRYLCKKFLKITIFSDAMYREHNPILGSALFFRRDAFDAIGGFDKDVFLYFEEGDICNTLKAKGYKIFFIYNAVIRHFYRRGHRSEENRAHFEKSAAYFFKKWPEGDTNRRNDFRRTEIVLLVSLIAALILFFTLGFVGGFAHGNIAAWVKYYAVTFVGSLASFLYGAVLFLCAILICLVIWTLSKSFITKARDPRRIFFAALRRSREMLLIIPSILFLSVVALAMGEANEFARVRLVDGTVIGWEHALFGGAYVFAALGAIHYPPWLIVSIIFSFNNMGLFLVGAGILLSYLAPRRFHGLVIAFCVGILLMVPIWLLVPVLSPQDRYIDNIYQLPIVPASLAAAVANYHPQAEIAQFLQSVRAEKTGLPALPTSTMPSAHVFWATITGYYLFRSGRRYRWLGWVALPFLAASTFGTVLLAQHYFMDVPVAIIIAAIAICLANLVGNAQV